MLWSCLNLSTGYIDVFLIRSCGSLTIADSFLTDGSLSLDGSAFLIWLAEGYRFYSFERLAYVPRFQLGGPAR